MTWIDSGRPWAKNMVSHSGRWVKVIVSILKNETGEVIFYEEDLPIYNGREDPSLFIWTEGNYSCDCNRELFFERARGNDDWDEVECSEGRFSVNLINAFDGEVFYREFKDS